MFFRLTTVRGVGILYLNLTLKIRFEMKDTHKYTDTGPVGRGGLCRIFHLDTAFFAPSDLVKAAEKILEQDNPSNERLEQLRQKALENTQLAFGLLKR